MIDQFKFIHIRFLLKKKNTHTHTKGWMSPKESGRFRDITRRKKAEHLRTAPSSCGLSTYLNQCLPKVSCLSPARRLLGRQVSEREGLHVRNCVGVLPTNMHDTLLTGPHNCTKFERNRFSCSRD